MMSFTKITVLSAALLGGAMATAPVELDFAEDYAILAKTGITGGAGATITGDIAVSPIAATAMTGFALILDSAGKFSKSTQVTGQVYAASYLGDTKTALTTAVGAMEAAYGDAAGRANADATRTNMGGGLLGGDYGGAKAPLTPGVYTFKSDVKLSDVTFKGGAEDVFILQIAGNLNVDASKKVTLADGAQAKNIFWQIAGSATIGAGAQMEGIFLVKTAAIFQTGSSLNGRILTQTMAALDHTTITQPTI